MCSTTQSTAAMTWLNLKEPAKAPLAYQKNDERWAAFTWRQSQVNAAEGEREVRGRSKLKVKQIVFVAFSRDETEMGFGYPKAEEERLTAIERRAFRIAIERMRAAGTEYHKTGRLMQMACALMPWLHPELYPAGPGA